MRTVWPDLTLQFAMAHDHDVLVCLGRILEVPVASIASNEMVSLPLSKGGLGLRSAVRSRVVEASWADCLPMVQKRHPQVASILLEGLNGGRHSLNVARECATSLAEAHGWIWSMESVLRFQWIWATYFSQGKGGRRHYPLCLQNALSFGLRVDPSLRGHSCVAPPRGS